MSIKFWTFWKSINSNMPRKYDFSTVLFYNYNTVFIQLVCWVQFLFLYRKITNSLNWMSTVQNRPNPTWGCLVLSAQLIGNFGFSLCWKRDAFVSTYTICYRIRSKRNESWNRKKDTHQTMFKIKFWLHFNEYIHAHLSWAIILISFYVSF